MSVVRAHALRAAAAAARSPARRAALLQAAPAAATYVGGTLVRVQSSGVEAATAPSSSSSSSGSSAAAAAAVASAAPSWHIKMLYDGECPLCMREVEMLRRRDAGKDNICFVDIADPTYSAADNAGITFQQAMERIHAVLPDGTIVTDVEVFRRCYEEVGLGWVYAVTRYKPVEDLANAVYGVWAKYRLPVTGRPDLAVVLQQKQTCGAPGADACEIPGAPGQQQ